MKQLNKHGGKGRSFTSTLRYDTLNKQSLEDLVKERLEYYAKNWEGALNMPEAHDPEFATWAMKRLAEAKCINPEEVDNFAKLEGVIPVSNNIWGIVGPGALVFGLARKEAEFIFKSEYKPYDVSKPMYCNLWQSDEIERIFDLVSNQQSTNYYTQGIARGGVGDDTTAATDADNGLQAVTNKLLVACDTGFPTAGGADTAKAIRYEFTFSEVQANFNWREEVIDAGAEARTWLRAVVDLRSGGTDPKPNTESWTLRIEPNIA